LSNKKINEVKNKGEWLSCIDLTAENAEDAEVLIKIYFLFSALSATSAVNIS